MGIKMATRDRRHYLFALQLGVQRAANRRHGEALERVGDHQIHDRLKAGVETPRQRAKGVGRSVVHRHLRVFLGRSENTRNEE